MPRTEYRNGHSVSLTECGCDGCTPISINGMACHETGCPDAWKDRMVDCFECGCEFLPESRHDRTCPDCLNPPDDDFDCQDDD